MATNKFTYLMGAGASKFGVPIVSEFNDAVDDFLKYLNNLELPNESYSDNLNRQIGYTKSQLKKKVFDECSEIMNEIKKHWTIDTYARKLSLTRKKQELRKLKSLISIFLIDHQLKHSADPRYDIFFATLFDNKNGAVSLPASTNIITWNYDFQLEKSASPFLEMGDIGDIQNQLNVYPNETNLLNTDQFSLIKLNGTAIGWIDGFHQDNHRILKFDLFENWVENRKIVIEELLAYYYWNTFKTGNSSFAIKYAWEDDEYSVRLRNNAKNMLSATSHLIIIGYSFPTFNRTVDKELLESMNNLKKVTIQTMEGNIEEIKNRFISLIGEDKVKNTNVEIELIKLKTGKEEFYIPFEYIGQ